MAYFFEEPSHTFDEYLLVPGYTSADCIPANVSLSTPVVRYNKKAGEKCPLTMNIPMVSAVMQSVSNDTLAIALAKEGGISFIYGSQTIEDQAAMIARVKSYKAGFVTSDSNIKPDQTLNELVAKIEQTGHSTVAVTENGESDGKLVGIITERDFRLTHVDGNSKVSEYMTPLKDLVKAKFNVKVEELDKFLNKFPFDLVYSPTTIENKLFEIRDVDDYIILHTAIIEDVDIFITGDKDFFDIDIDKPEIMTTTEFLEKYYN